MWLPLFLLILSPDVAEPNCHDHRYGAPSKSCKRVKDATFQIRGVKIVPMWEFMLLKEPSLEKRVKRSSVRNATLPRTNGFYAGIQQRHPQPIQQGPVPLPAQRSTPGYTRTHDAQMPAIHHHTLIQPIDSNAPRPVQRHLVQRQVQSPTPQSSFFSTNIGQHQRKFKRQDDYPTAPAQPQWENKNVWNGEQETKLQDKGEETKSKKKKSKKNRKKMSKMCKMCKQLSAEDSSEEREVACEICRKASENRRKDGEEEERGPLKTALNVRPIPKTKHEQGEENEEEEEEEEETKEKGGTDEEADDEYIETLEQSPDATPTTTAKPTTKSSQPTIVDFAERTKQNRLMRIPVYRGKSVGKNNQSAGNGTDENRAEEEDKGSEFATNIRNQTKSTKYSDKPNVKYSYPPKDTLPLQTCFHNPSGYVCCNLELNNVVESTYKEIREAPNFNPCNLQVIANKVQRASEKMFEHPFESIVSHADFAQNINFAGDLVCKLEIDGKYMIAYGTPYHADDAVGPQGPDGNPLPVRSFKL